MITPVILSGGAGTRLWPASRAGRPKQLLALTSPQTMLELTLARAAGPGYAPPILVGNVAHADEIERQLGSAGIAGATLILEPAMRNTAPATALAALAAAPDDRLLVMPSDHVIADVAAFRAAIARALPLVDQGWLVTFGITPDRPETGYGYIHRGETLAPGVERVDRFVEKPDLATAQLYLAAGDYSWNGGIFLFTARAYLDALETHAPDMLDAARAAMAKSRRDGDRLYPDTAAFERSPADSIDYAVMEKAARVAVVPVEMGWSDVGSWAALHAINAQDASGNVVHGDVIAIDTQNCLIRTDGPIVTTVGVSDLVIVATADAILILPRSESQRVKQVVDALRDRGGDAC